MLRILRYLISPSLLPAYDGPALESWRPAIEDEDRADLVEEQLPGYRVRVGVGVRFGVGIEVRGSPGVRGCRTPSSRGTAGYRHIPAEGAVLNESETNRAIAQWEFVRPSP